MVLVWGMGMGIGVGMGSKVGVGSGKLSGEWGRGIRGGE